MSKFKWIALGAVGTAVMAGGIVALVFWLTSGAVESAESFLRLVGRGQYEEAYRAAAPEFRVTQDVNAFRGAMQRAGLDKYDSASWSTRRIRNNFARVGGTARTIDGKSMPLAITMTRDHDAWLVTGIQVGTPAASRDDD